MSTKYFIINYVYILIEREFIKTNENIYKIGKTKQPNLSRFSQYPNGSMLLYQSICENCDITELKIINLFKKKYIHRKDIGNEYFEGNFKDMIYDISSLINIKNENIPIHFSNTKENIAYSYKHIENFSDISNGGNNRIIKIINSNGKYSRYPYILLYIKEYVNDIPVFEEYLPEFSNGFLEKLINKKILQPNLYYDINNIDFLKIIDNQRKSIFIKNFDEYITNNNIRINKNIHNYIINSKNKIFSISCFLSDFILNDSLYITSSLKNCNIEDNFFLISYYTNNIISSIKKVINGKVYIKNTYSIQNNKLLLISNIKNIYFESSLLKFILPRFILYNSQNKFILSNFDNSILDNPNIEKNNFQNKIELYSDNELLPWRSNIKYNKYIDSIYQYIKNYNLSQNTIELELLDMIS